MICKACKKAADDKQYGIEAHAVAGCKAATITQTINLRVPDAFDKYVLGTNDESGGSTFCDCQHANERLVNMARVGPEMKKEILGDRATS
jgi:hypothetical protein